MSKADKCLWGMSYTEYVLFTCLSTSDVPSRLSPFGLEPLLTAQRTGGTSELKTA